MNLSRTVIPRHGAISICLSLRAHRGNLLNSIGIPSRNCRAALAMTVIKSCTRNDWFKKVALAMTILSIILL